MKRYSCLLGLVAFSLQGQTTGTLRGTVTIEASGSTLHHATITVGRAGRTASTKEDGTFEITGLAPGSYSVTAHMHALTDMSQTVDIQAGGIATADFSLRLSVVKEAITVTASGTEQTTFESFQTVASLESLELAQKAATSLGEVLNNQPGVAKRSFGPGSSRPVIRGFDGDRVLIMQDGAPTGTLSSQSGDHGETIDTTQLERLEVVKGPATLLYGSNAIGGVVNAVTSHHKVHEHPHPGLSGHMSAVGGSNNGHAGASAGFEYGVGNWLLWGNGGAQRTGDYHSAEGTVRNSGTRVTNSSMGFGRYDEPHFFDLGYGYEEGRYGVPFANEFEGGDDISLASRRHNIRFNGGVRQLKGFAESFRLNLNYSDWQHQELEGDQIGTTFQNKQASYRGVFQQRTSGKWSGSFGFSGLNRRYRTQGEETLAPPVNQNGIAAFTLQEFGFERFRLQFGGRVENNRYSPLEGRKRSFTGFSGAAGVHVPLWKGGAFVLNGTQSFRAPALEELYNNGPHLGNFAFEIGNPNLNRERSRGVDASLRHQSRRLRAELNTFLYRIDSFVYLAPTGEIKDGLRVADYAQAPTRFTGTEMGLDLGLRPSVWLNLGMDYVNAQLRESKTPLPRIPPLRGRVGVEYRRGGFSVKPELALAGRQGRLFPTETHTAGYALVNLGATYTMARQHLLHQISANLYNATDQLYRNHLSFIKDLAPEIGRGVRFTYTVRFF